MHQQTNKDNIKHQIQQRYKQKATQKQMQQKQFQHNSYVPTSPDVLVGPTDSVWT